MWNNLKPEKYEKVREQHFIKEQTGTVWKFSIIYTNDMISIKRFIFFQEHRRLLIVCLKIA